MFARRDPANVGWRPRAASYLLSQRSRGQNMPSAQNIPNSSPTDSVRFFPSDPGLARGAIGLPELLFQSITAMAPAGALAVSVVVGASYAGGSLTLAVLFA